MTESVGKTASPRTTTTEDSDSVLPQIQPHTSEGPMSISILDLHSARSDDAALPSVGHMTSPAALTPSPPKTSHELDDAASLAEQLSAEGLAQRRPTLKTRRRSKSMRALNRDIQLSQAPVETQKSMTRIKTLGALPPPKKHSDGNAAKIKSKLGVDEETMKLEKGMKKLGICDQDIQASIEIRRHCGVILAEPNTKEEFLLGFSTEQLQRIKAVKTLGTSEGEILDTYCKQISDLGVPQIGALLK
ncbi:Aste57867_18635 [Aphanomyces stellatus]|uniref:Aste57867_18635 protein n=1 Tax=Aphanomyces stellatus TaxID=120398 RepID=A0A485LAN0_9STRA|nr:hypothetical protein As57867_018573 [Aphanomyces stellatus]VFT95370.1 Aste57867_18635 [Aphanomyces stellatus]